MGDSVSEGTIAAIEKKPGALPALNLLCLDVFGGVFSCAKGPTAKLRFISRVALCHCGVRLKESW